MHSNFRNYVWRKHDNVYGRGIIEASRQMDCQRIHH
jgi:hypothetical protein